MTMIGLLGWRRGGKRVRKITYGPAAFGVLELNLEGILPECKNGGGRKGLKAYETQHL